MKIGIFPGRFQGITLSHEYIIRNAAKRCDKVIIVVVDSGKRNKNNPYSFFVRRNLLKNVIKDLDNVYISCYKNGYLKDMLDYLKVLYGFTNEDKLIVHCGRDRTESYIKQLPYDVVLRSFTRIDDISATKLRDHIRNLDYNNFIKISPKSLHNYFNILLRMENNND